MKRQKILFINPKQFGYSSGYYYYCKYLRDYYDITFLCLDLGFPKVEIDGVTVKYLSLSKNRYTRLLRFTSVCLKEEKNTSYDIVFTVYFVLAFIIGLAGHSKNTVLDIRSGTISNFSLKRFILNLLLKLSAKCFKNITILSESLRESLRLKPEKCFILPLGAEIYRKEKNYDKLHLLYVGTLNHRKIDETIKGLSCFYKKHGSSIIITYDIIGFGSKIDEKCLNDTINECGLSAIVTFHGRKNHTELVPFFEKCNVGISYIPVTAYFEFQPPTKTYEYILAGLICIATETHEHKQLITSDNGILCGDNPDSFAGSLEYLYKNRHKFHCANIINSCSEYSWKNIILRKLKPFFEGLIQ